MRTIALVLTTLLALSLAPSAAAACEHDHEEETLPTGTHVSTWSTSCTYDNGSWSSGSAYVEDDMTGQIVWISGYGYEDSYDNNGTSSTYEGQGIGFGTYNDRGNLVPTTNAYASQGSSTSPGGTSAWRYAYAHFGWGPFYQSVGGPLPTLP